MNKITENRDDCAFCGADGHLETDCKQKTWPIDQETSLTIPPCGNVHCRYADYTWHDSACPRIAPVPGDKMRAFIEKVYGR